MKNASNCDHLENRDSKAGSQIKLPYKNILNFRLNPHGMVYFEYSLWSTLFFGGLEQKREAPDGEKPEPSSYKYDHCARDDWPLSFWVLSFLQARYAWKTWYWCNTLFQVHSSLVKWGIYFGWMWIFLHLFSFSN